MPSAFPDVSKIQFEGAKSKNPLAFKHYNANEIVEGKTMCDHLRFSVVYWHTFRGRGVDVFGAGTALRLWDDGTESVKNAQNRVRVAFDCATGIDILRTDAANERPDSRHSGREHLGDGP